MKALRFGRVLAVILISIAALLIGLPMTRSALGTPAALPIAHLGYGLNVWDQTQLAAGLGFDWIKLFEEAGPPPTTTLPYKVLYRIFVDGYPASLNTYLQHVHNLAQAGLGKVQAYEIGNEPNLRGAGFWGDQNVNPEAYADLLCAVYPVIKSVDPHALIISAGLAPVGPWGSQYWNNVMDETVFAARLLARMKGVNNGQFCIDGFGYHPHGFAFAPETDYHDVPNGFAFRSAERMHDVMVAAGAPDMKMWATEFGWIRYPESDPWIDASGNLASYSWCNRQPEMAGFLWMLVSEQQQADYLVRAFQYADANWPWMGPMFVWNADFFYRGTSCTPQRFYSLFHATEGNPNQLSPTLAYTALMTMPKRYSGMPTLSVQPSQFLFLSQIGAPTAQTQTLQLTNLSLDSVLTWTMTISPAAEFPPIIAGALTGTLTGTASSILPINVDTSSITQTGMYTAYLIITAEPTDTIGSPAIVPINVLTVDQLHQSYLPTITENYAIPHQMFTSSSMPGSSAESPATAARYLFASAISSHLNREPVVGPQIKKDPVSQLQTVELPPPHLGYGLNVRANFDMADDLGFEWVKLYESILHSPNDFPPQAAAYHVLYRLDVFGQPASLDEFLNHVQQIALAGRGKVDAYEIGNEPNLSMFWGGQNPNPEKYGRLLCNVRDVIKAVDPTALVISAGLAPVGRTKIADWVYAMDDRIYTKRMFDAIRAAYPTEFPCMDGFGYHPQGYPYPPEISYEELEAQHPDDNGNDFRFRATEWFHTLMVNYGIGNVPIWPTEFGWMRDATYDTWDGAPPWENYGTFCWNDLSFRQWSWMRVSEQQQADYLVRAFQYADAYMPWLGPMFVYNVDWNSQGWECDHVKFFSIYKAATGRTDSDPLTKVPALAVAALRAMPKRSAFIGSTLQVSPDTLTFLTEVATPTIQTRTLSIANLSSVQPLTWTIAVSGSAELQPVVTPLSGTSATSVMVRIDSSSVSVPGQFQAHLIVTADPTTTIGSPFTVTVNLIAVDHLQRAYLPLIARNYTAPQPVISSTSELGLAFVSSAESPANETRYQSAQAIGSHLNRWPMYWPQIEKNPISQPRVFDWTAQDANVIADINHGLSVLPILMLTPIGLDTAGSQLAPAPKVGDGLQLHMQGGSLNVPSVPSSQGSPPQGLYLSVFSDGSDVPGSGKTINQNNRWAYFVNAAVNRYQPGGALAQSQGWNSGQGVRYWEIWNEEDLDQFFIGTPTDFARLQKVAYLAAKQADPDATIVFGGLAHFQKPGWLNDVLNIIATDPMSTTYHGFMDAVASHSYSWAWQTFGYLYEDRVRLDAHGFNTVKLWLTETGVPVCDDPPYEFCPSPYRGTMSEQADFLIQTTVWADWVQAEKIVWFQLYDDCGNDGHYDAFGLVRNPPSVPACPLTARDGTPRAAYQTFNVVRQYLTNVQPYWRDRRTGTTTDWANGNQEILAFKRPATSQRIVTMWTRKNSADTVILTATSTSAVLITPNGTSQTITPVNGVYSIALPAATNYSTSTNDGSAAIGGSPRILIESDPNVMP